MSSLRSILRGFVVALVATIVVAFVRLFVLIPLFGIAAPVAPFIVAVMLAAWLSGLTTGLMATALGTAAGTYFFIEQANARGLTGPFQKRLALFAVAGALVSWLFGALHSARRRVEQRQRQLEHEITERRNAEAAERQHRERLMDEMRRREEAELALREREERIRMAVESADIGTWDYNPITHERQWSKRSRAIFGIPPDADVTQGSFLNHLHPDDRAPARRATVQALDPAGDGRYEIDYRVLWPDGTIRWVIAKGQALFEGTGRQRRATRFIGTVLDITDRKLAEDALRASEGRLQAILNNASAVIYLKDVEGRYLLVNKRFEQLFNVSQQQIVGKTDSDLFSSDEIVAALRANDRQVQDTQQSLEFEEVVPQEDGPHTYISVKFPVFDAAGKCTAVGGISTDISDRKKAADALAAEREFLRHTIEVQDQERQLVSCEIHDGLVQYATGALMQLESMRTRMNSTASAQKVTQVVGILQKTVAEGRRIINGIRTPVLDDLGVVAAVQQLIDDEDRAGLHVESVLDEGLGRMAATIEEALYRILQEAFANALKHSRSKTIRVELARRGDHVHLAVRDWGIGFEPANVSAALHHGLKGIATRARIAGGRCTIDSAPGKGTEVAAEVPYLARNGAHEPQQATQRGHLLRPTI